jgi:cytochrome o ubiquinol oxidase subunit 2
MISKIARRGIPLLSLAALSCLAGCNTVLLNASGDIAAQQGQLIVVSTLLMLLIVVPVIVATLYFAWRYRQSNTTAPYSPDWDHSTKLELLIWGAPLLIIIALGLITWISTHLLEPTRPLTRISEGRPIPASTKPLVVQVVALDWKWLFIYPEQGIATVNQLVTPVDVPVRFKITASSVMNSFFIPAMAGQIYAMPGMETTLNAVMNKPGTYEGFSANFSGAGFSQMHFKYNAVPAGDFDAWVAKTKAGASPLNRPDYLALEKPSIAHPVTMYSSVDPELYGKILNLCVADGAACVNQTMAADTHRAKGDMAMKDLPKEELARRVAAQAAAEVCTTPTKTEKK